MDETSEDYIIKHTGKTFEETATIRRQAILENQESEPASFKEVFGDLSDSFFEGDLDLSGLDLNSLEGCPFNIEDSLHIDNNPNLKSLKYVSTVFELEGYFSVDIDLFLASLESHLYIYDVIEEINIYVDNSSQAKIEEALIQFSIIENDSDYAFAKDISLKSFFIERKGDKTGDFGIMQGYSHSHSSAIIRIGLNSGGMERLYNIYQSVGFDRKKFDRTLELL